MTFAIIGCGGTGLAIGIFLAKDKNTKKIVCVDLNVKRLERFQKIIMEVNTDVSLETHQLNAKTDSLNNVIKNCTVAINSASPECNIPIMKACSDCNVNYIDLASNPFDYPGLDEGTTLNDQLKLNEKFKAKNLVAITNAGFSPGFTDILCKYFVAKNNIESIDSIKIYFGEIINAEKGKLVCSWSPYTLMLETISPPTIYSKGKIRELTLSESLKEVVFPEPIGKLKVKPFNGHPELKTISEFLGVPVGYLEVGGGMYLNNLDLNDIIVEALGQQVKKSLQFQGDVLERLAQSFEPSDLFAENYQKGLITDEIFCGLIEIVGRKKASRIKYTVKVMHDLKEVLKTTPGVSIATFVVSFVPGILALMLAKGKIHQKGVLVPAQLENSNEIIEQTKSKGLNISEVITTN